MWYKWSLLILCTLNAMGDAAHLAQDSHGKASEGPPRVKGLTRRAKTDVYVDSLGSLQEANGVIAEKDGSSDQGSRKTLIRRAKTALSVDSAGETLHNDQQPDANSGDVQYTKPNPTGACGITKDDKIVAHESCACEGVEERELFCKDQCDFDVNCVGYVGLKGPRCQYATTSVCAAGCEKYSNGNVGPITSAPYSDNGNYGGCFVKDQAELGDDNEVAADVDNDESTGEGDEAIATGVPEAASNCRSCDGCGFDSRCFDLATVHLEWGEEDLERKCVNEGGEWCGSGAPDGPVDGVAEGEGEEIPPTAPEVEHPTTEATEPETTEPEDPQLTAVHYTWPQPNGACGITTTDGNIAPHEACACDHVPDDKREEFCKEQCDYDVNCVGYVGLNGPRCQYATTSACAVGCEKYGNGNIGPITTAPYSGDGNYGGCHIKVQAPSAEAPATEAPATKTQSPPTEEEDDE